MHIYSGKGCVSFGKLGFACWGRWAGCDEHVSKFSKECISFFQFPMTKLAALLAVSFTVSNSTYVLIYVHFAQGFPLSLFPTKYQISLRLVSVSFAGCCNENPWTWNSPENSGGQARFWLQTKRRRNEGVDWAIEGKINIPLLAPKERTTPPGLDFTWFFKVIEFAVDIKRDRFRLSQCTAENSFPV